MSGSNLAVKHFRHAGYRYSGRTAGYAYAQMLNPNMPIKRVFVIGPSHHSYLHPSIQASQFDKVETPLGSIDVDQKTIRSLALPWLNPKDDVEEHSLEMQYPYLRRVMDARGQAFSLVPILVCHPNPSERQHFISCLASELDADDLVVISSDFCHWGARFDFTPNLLSISKEPALHLRIKKLDELAMESITQGVESFTKYLSESGNTICGRVPIQIAIELIDAMGWRDHTWKWLHYEQSSSIVNADSPDSQVSYVAGVYS